MNFSLIHSPYGPSLPPQFTWLPSESAAKAHYIRRKSSSKQLSPKNSTPLTSFLQQLQHNNCKLRILFKGEVCLKLTCCIHSNWTERRRKPAITHFFLWIIFCYSGESVSVNHKYTQPPILMQIKIGSCRKNACSWTSISHSNPITSFLLTTLLDSKAKTAALLLHVHICLQAKKKTFTQPPPPPSPW